MPDDNFYSLIFVSSIIILIIIMIVIYNNIYMDTPVNTNRQVDTSANTQNNTDNSANTQENYRSCAWFGCKGATCDCQSTKYEPTIAYNPFRQPASSTLYIDGNTPADNPDRQTESPKSETDHKL
jgi:type II secretory pathway component PulC